MTERSTRELLTRLVAAFGDADRVCELLAPEAQWWITPSVGVLASPTVGREAIRDAMRVIFGQLYTDVHTTVHHGPMPNLRHYLWWRLWRWLLHKHPPHQ
jgi:hypothetical protein